jgi:hypothetical protein
VTIEGLGKKVDSLEAKVDRLDTKIDGIDAKVNARVDALALSCRQEFTAIRQEMADGFAVTEKRFAAIEAMMATKRDLYQLEVKILDAIGSLGVEIKNHNARLLVLERTVRP